MRSYGRSLIQSGDASMRRGRDTTGLFPSHVRTHRGGKTICKPGRAFSPEGDLVGTLILHLPVSRIVRINVC